MISGKMMMLAAGAVVLLLLIAVPTITFALGRGRRLQAGAPAETHNVAVKVGIALLLLLLALAGLVAFGAAGGTACELWGTNKDASCECVPCCEDAEEDRHANHHEEAGLPRNTQGAREVTH